jgi:hypothetical protein
MISSGLQFLGAWQSKVKPPLTNYLATASSYPKRQSWNGAPLRRAPGLLGQHRQIAPGIVDRSIPAEAAGMIGQHLAVAADHDPVGIGPICTARRATLAITE